MIEPQALPGITDPCTDCGTRVQRSVLSLILLQTEGRSELTA